MSWIARTTFSQIRVGTSLRLERFLRSPDACPRQSKRDWQMTHRTPYDPPIEIQSPGLNQQDWVIRSARPFAPFFFALIDIYSTPMRGFHRIAGQVSYR